MTAGVERPRVRSLHELERLAEEAVLGALGGATQCAYVDWPAHGNVGDSALWLAGLRVLARAGARVAYTSSEGNFDPAVLRRLLPDGPVLIAAGGNLGDLWPAHQRFRERVLADLPDRHVVQLAQSVHFEDEAAARRARDAFGRHPALTLQVRDRPSLGRCRDELGVEAELVPDLAFALGPLRRTAEPVVDVLWLARTDKERLHAPPAGGVEVVDWVRPDPAPATVAARLEAAARRLAPRFGDTVEQRLRARQQETLARVRLARGIELLCRGRVVVTDRLHAHVLCCLLEMPHVLLDQSYGKVLALHDTWTNGIAPARVAADAHEALELARELAS